LRYLTLIEVTVARFVGTGVFLIGYSVIRNKNMVNQRNYAIIFNKILFI